MSILENQDFLLTMVKLLFGLGAFAFIVGTIILMAQTIINKDIRTIATQTNQLAQKGIMDGISGLIGNASMLLDATSKLVKTNSGIGVFLIIIGVIMMGGAIALYIYFGKGV